MAPDLCIYCEFPRKAAKGYAIKCIQRACKRLQAGELGEPPMTEREALVKLYRASKRYAQSGQGRQADKSKIPHASTFFNQSRYLDPPESWDVVIGDNNGTRQGKFGVAQSALLAAHAATDAQQGTGEAAGDGFSDDVFEPRRGDGRFEAGIVLQGRR